MKPLPGQPRRKTRRRRGRGHPCKGHNPALAARYAGDDRPLESYGPQRREPAGEAER